MPSGSKYSKPGPTFIRDPVKREAMIREALAEDKPPVGPLPGDDYNPATGAVEHEPLTAADVRMVERAVRQRWPMSDAVRASVVRRMHKIVEDELSEAKDAVAASGVLIRADSLNVKEEIGHETAKGRVVREIGQINQQINIGTGEQPQELPQQPPEHVIRVQYDDDFFGNARKVAEAAASPEARLAQLQAFQDAHLRKAVGED